MYFICDKNGILLSWTDKLEYESNTTSEKFPYVDENIIVKKVDDVDINDANSRRLDPEEWGKLSNENKKLKYARFMFDDEPKEAENSKLRFELIKKAGKLIEEKKKEVAENRDIGFLTEKFRIAKSILRKTAEEDDANDFETEVQLRGKSETKDELAKKVKKKYKKMYRRMIKLDAYYSRFLLRIEKRNNVKNINNAFERFKEELDEQVRR